MQTLIETRFEDRRLPDGWIEGTFNHRFEDQGLFSGRHTNLEVLLPHGAWGSLDVEADVVPGSDGAIVSCGDNTVSLTADLGRGHYAVSVYGRAQLAFRELPARKIGKPCRVTLSFDQGRSSVAVDGEEIVSANDPLPTPFSGLLQLSFWDNCFVRRVRVAGDESATVTAPAARKRDDFELEVNVDFFDDLMHAPFTPGMFDALFAEFKQWGVSRCHWIYYGGTKHGWWKCCPHNVDQRAAKTVENSGEIFDAAVAASHAHGIELYGMIKPFDMGFFYSFGDGTPQAAQRGRLPRIGGPVGWIADFPARHREFCMARKPDACGPAVNEVFTRIDLVKEDDRPSSLAAGDLRLYVSDDNTSYKSYSGPMECEETVEDYPVWEHTASGGRPTGQTRRSRVIRLKNLELRNKYFALATEGRRASFANTFIDLVHVFGPKGEERLITYGVKPRHGEGRVDGAASSSSHTDFRELGIEFDTVPGTPTAVFPGFDAIRARHVLDFQDGFIAVARGKDPHPVATLSPSFPESRAWWLEWVQDCLDAGADGIELRVRNHHSPFAWAEFGFEQPVVDAFKARQGIDLLSTDDFDRTAWRRLRGESYTEFYRQAKALVKKYGKKLGLHVSQTMCMEPEFGSAMEIDWDWRTWIDEGLADSVTMKEVWPRTRFSDEILRHTRAKGIPVFFCPYGNNLWSQPGGAEIVANRIRLAREQGFDGFQYYECCSVVRAKTDGTIEMEQPELREVLRREFAGR